MSKRLRDKSITDIFNTLRGKPMTDDSQPKYDVLGVHAPFPPMPEAQKNTSITTLVYLDEIAEGDTVQFSRHPKPKGDEPEMVHPLAAMMLRHPPHEDINFIVLRKKELGGMVSLICVDDDGEQFNFMDTIISTVKKVTG